MQIEKARSKKLSEDCAWRKWAPIGMQAEKYTTALLPCSTASCYASAATLDPSCFAYAIGVTR